MNKLILGDNLEILKSMPSESVDLIYLDPPFFSNRHYECIWGDKGEVRSFEDRWSGGMEHYIAWLKERVQEMHRILKPTGSLYLHCDYHANAYIRTLILDKIFGPENFRNEIVWCYRRWTAGKHSFQRMHDTIYFYSKTKDYKFNQLKEDFSEKTIVAQFKRKIENGKVIQDKDTPMTRDPEDGIAMKDWWELSYLHPISKERCGYPTQNLKPCYIE
jgi:DNA modification methylase